MNQQRSVDIRIGREEDRGPVVALLEAEGLEANFVADEFLVAEDEGGVVGCARLAPLPEGLSEMASVAVAPDRRGEGIGRALVRRALASAEQPVHALCLQPAFFRNLGFEAVDEIPPSLEAKARACCADRTFVPMVWRPA